jgi:hypothetical protein
MISTSGSALPVGPVASQVASAVAASARRAFQKPAPSAWSQFGSSAGLFRQVVVLARPESPLDLK